MAFFGTPLVMSRIYLIYLLLINREIQLGEDQMLKSLQISPRSSTLSAVANISPVFFSPLQQLQIHTHYSFTKRAGEFEA